MYSSIKEAAAAALKLNTLSTKFIRYIEQITIMFDLDLITVKEIL